MKADAGFSLVEVAVALGIAAVGLVVMVGLLPVGLGASRDGVAELQAAQLAQDLFATLRAQRSETLLWGEEITLAESGSYVWQLENPDGEGVIVEREKPRVDWWAVKLEVEPLTQEGAAAGVSRIQIRVRWPGRQEEGELFVTLIPQGP